MGREAGKQQLMMFVKKYSYVVFAALIGVFLMLWPSEEKAPEKDAVPEVSVSPDLEMELSAILSRISGVGRAEVLLTEAAGSDVIYQIDTGQNSTHSDTVIITDQDREETGLVKQILPPVYKGALVVCEGADSAAVCLSVVDAVKSVTGLPSNCITVLKMK